MNWRTVLFNFISCAAVFGITGYLFLQYEPETYATIFGTRDFIRALNWWHSPPILYGPELSGGGYAPGPFFYILASIPLELGGDWYTLGVCKYLLAALAGVVLWFLGKRALGPACGFWLAALYIGSTEVLGNLTKDWNASFQIFFSCLCILGLIVSFDSPRGAGRRFLWATFVLIGLSMQIHGSFFIFGIIFVGFQLFAPALQWQRFSLKDSGIGLLFLMLPLTPFFLWLFAGQNLIRFGIEAPPPLGVHVGLWDWIFSRAQEVVTPAYRPGSARFMPDASEYFLRNGALNYVMVFAATYVFLVRPAFGVWLRRVTVLVGIMGLIYLPLYLAGMSSRYTYHWHAAYLIFGGMFSYLPLRDMFSRSARWLPLLVRQSLRASIILALAYYASWWLGEGLYGQHRTSRMALAPDDLGNATNLALSQTEVVCKTIYEQTGWPAEKISRRLFLVQFDDDIDLWAPCEAYLKRHPVSMVQQEVVPNGYFLIRDVTWEDRPDYWKTWWLKQSLPPEFTGALERGQVKILPETKAEGITLIPFRRLDPLALPEEVSNVGYGYREAPGEELLTSLDMQGEKGTVLSADRSALWFYYNRCRPDQAWCRTGVRVSGVDELVDRSSKLKIEIYGTPLSQRMSWHHQYMAQEWKGVVLRVGCGTAVRTIPVVSRLAKLRYEERVENNYLMTPFERTVLNPCKGPVHFMDLAIDMVMSADNLSITYDERPDVVIRHNFSARLRSTAAATP